MPEGIQKCATMNNQYVTSSPSVTLKFPTDLKSILSIENSPVSYPTKHTENESLNENVISLATSLNGYDSYLSKKGWVMKNIVGLLSVDADLTDNIEVVDRGTFKKLKAGQYAIWVAKRLLTYGSPDQYISLYGTRGESWARSKINQTRYVKIDNKDNAKKAEQIEKIIKCQAGNCGEFSAVVYMILANLNIDDDIYRIKCKDVDHSFCIIGDIDNDKSIAVDAWPIVPSVHFLNDSVFEIDEIMWMHKRGERFPLSIEKAHQLHKITNDEVLEFIKRTRDIINERDYIRCAEMDPLAVYTYNHLFSENHPMTLFKNEESGEHLGLDMPRSYAERQLVFIRRYLNLERTGTT